MVVNLCNPCSGYADAGAVAVATAMAARVALLEDLMLPAKDETVPDADSSRDSIVVPHKAAQMVAP